MTYDAVVVGSGPNGLSAAVTLAREGLSVGVLEANATPGGGTRTAELTRSGFHHDVCSAVHPLAAGSPFLSRLPLGEHGLRWIQPPLPLAHPLDEGPPALLDRSLDRTVEGLEEDGPAYRRLVGPLVEAWRPLFREVLGPLRVPSHPLLLLRFGLRALPPSRAVWRLAFRGEPARALYAGLAAHSFLPLERPPSSAIALVLGVAGHAVGWPIPAGGSGRIAEALAAHLRALGGELHTGRRVRDLGDLPPARARLLAVTPRQLLRIAGPRLPAGYRRRLAGYRYGPGAFKLDWALSEPIPWRSAACARAGTLHLGGSAAEVAAGEAAVWRGEHPERPFVLLAQPSRFDPERAPEGSHTAWAYCHVPNGSAADMTGRIEAQVERFAPGFRDCVLARHVMGPAQLEARNANCVGGDINGGSQELGQLFARPVARAVPYATPLRGLYLCSASTPPGGGVHGMCGFHAARAALRREFGIEPRPSDEPPASGTALASDGGRSSSAAPVA